MKKQIINAETGEWAEHDVAYADAVVVHLDGAKRLFISGVVAEGEDIETQTRSVLKQIEALVADHDGGIEDIVRVRVYISQPEMDEKSLEIVHDVRNEFFVQDHLPASTLVEVEALVSDEFLIEIDADTIIPDNSWDVEHR